METGIPFIFIMIFKKFFNSQNKRFCFEKNIVKTMLDRKLHKFYLSYKLNGNIEAEWIEGINLRHAKDKLQHDFPEATDIMDWTFEKPGEFEIYKNKYIDFRKQEWIDRYKQYPEFL
jgi:hypothetical protein